MKILLIVYDNDSFLHWFPLGLGYIAAVLKREGHDVEIYQQDAHHFPESHLTAHLEKSHYDVVGIGVIAGYYQYRKILKISEAIRRSKDKPFFIIGGHGPTPEPEFFLKKTGADAVILGEGEETVVELCDALSRGRSWKDVKGIAYIDNDTGKRVMTGSRPLIKDLDTIPYPAWDLFDIGYYSLFRFPNISHNQRGLPIITGRGCPYTCNFCYRMEKGMRPRTAQSIVAEVRELMKRYGVTYISFCDDLFMVSEARTKDLCDAFLTAGLGINWYCNGRLNFASKEILQLMKRAGCVFVNYGIEAMDDRILKNMNKALTIEQIVRGVENTLAVGISPGLNIIFGNIGEDRETLNKGVAFLLKYDDASQLRTIRPVTPYPGSPLYYDAIDKGLLKDCEDFYERKHINSDLLTVNFTGMSDIDFHQSLLEANKALLANHFKKKLQRAVEQSESLYIKKNAAFRGFRQT